MCVLLYAFVASFLVSFFPLSMSGSEPGEMAPESSQAVVFPKFDMHIHTSILTAEELKDVVSEYCIPVDLHPRLPPPGLTMNKLSSWYIRIYLEHLEQGGLRIPFPPSSLPLLSTLECTFPSSSEEKESHKNPEPDRSGSEGALSPTPLHHAAPKNAGDPLTVVPNDAARAAVNVEKEVVDLSDNTCVTTPSSTVNQPSPRLEHDG
ncbi:hypothetical protein Tco_1117362 [Tanacetum coccineum]